MTKKERTKYVQLWRFRKPPCLHCTKQYFSKGLCEQHYHVARRYGDPLVVEKVQEIKHNLADNINMLVIEAEEKIKKLRTKI